MLIRRNAALAGIVLGAAAAIVLLTGCGQAVAALEASPPIRVTGASPYPASCGTTPYPDSEVEFSLAADRARPERLVGTWIQNARGGTPAVAYSRDGGASWNVIVPPGLAACTGSEYLRSTDPWLSVGPDGVAYLATLPVGAGGAVPAVQVSRSDDGGATWSFPVFVERRTTSERDDKPTLAADPYRAGSVYASWSRLRIESTPTGPTVSVEFSRSRD